MPRMIFVNLVMYAATCQGLDGHVWEFLAMEHSGS